MARKATKRMILHIFPLFAVGIGAGLLNGLLGAGGGIIIVYGLRKWHFGGVNDPRSVFASALAVMLPLSLLSAVQYIKNGSLAENSLGILILPAILGGAAGALLLRQLSPKTLSRIFSAVVLISGIILLL